jgi:hypothetical protein
LLSCWLSLAWIGGGMLAFLGRARVTIPGHSARAQIREADLDPQGSVPDSASADAPAWIPLA